MNSKRVLVAILIFIMTVPGCWDLEEIDRRAFVTALGIDLKPKGLMVLTAQLPLPRQMLPPGSTSGGKEGKSFHTITATARDVFDAFGVLQSKTSRHLVVQQNRLIVIGEEAARLGVNPILDWIFRSPKLSPQSLIFIARHRLAKEILSGTPSVSNMPGLEFSIASQLATKENYTDFVPAWRFRKIMVNKTRDLYAPLIDMDPEEGQYLKEGLAVFDGDFLVGELSREEAQIFNVLTNQMIAGTMSFGLVGRERGQVFSMRNMVATTKIKVNLRQGKPFLGVVCKINGALSETNDIRQRLTLCSLEKLEKKVEREMQLRVTSLIHKLQSLHSDSIGFGEQLRAQHYRIWKEINWKKIFPTASFRVSVKARIIRNGVFR